MPCLASTLPPLLASFRTKLTTPAMASEPYCAAAPSRSTSTRSMALAGMAEMSGPWAPSEAPLEIHWMTAPRCRRLLLTSTSVWSGAMPRRLIGRSNAAASRDGFVLTWKAGMVVRSRLLMSPLPWPVNAPLGMASTGTGESAAERGAARVPTVTTISSMSWASSLSAGSSAVSAKPAGASIAATPSIATKVACRFNILNPPPCQKSAERQVYTVPPAR